MANPAERDYIDWHRAAAQKLQQLGFPRDRAEKALVATGHADVGNAVQWLKAHAADVSVSKSFAREYVLFLAPIGALSKSLEVFWKESYKKTGRNAAHALFPHVTLSSFFRAQDFEVPNMLNIMSNVVQTMAKSHPGRLRLFFHTTEGYIGLFLEENAMNWVKESIDMFVGKMYDKMGIRIQPHGRQLHMSLAYQYEREHQKALESMARSIDVNAAVDWELQLYSRDPRFSGCDVAKVAHSFLPRSKNDLQLGLGQHVYVSPDATAFDAWKRGTCFETGLSGMFPENYIEKGEAWTCWIRHCSLPLLPRAIHPSERLPERQLTLERLAKSSNGDVMNRSASPMHAAPFHANNTDRPKNAPLNHSSTSISRSLTDQTDNSADARQPAARAEGPRTHEPRLFSRTRSLFGGRSDSNSNEKTGTSSLGKSAGKSMSNKPRSRQMLLMRHAERVDIVFGHEWTQQQFDASGFYTRSNLNLPRRIPQRSGGPDTFYQDSPITEMGKCQARLVGEELHLRHVSIDAVYSSPALRSIQTAYAILEGLGVQGHVPIRVEVGLFEWLAWCRGVMPKWMTPIELKDFGLDVDPNYKTCVQVKSMKMTETAEHFYNRSHAVVKSIVKTVEDGNVLVVGHAATLDACTRQLIGEGPRAHEDLVRIVQKVPYCGLAVAKEQMKGNWKLVEPPVPSLTHGTNGKFDWKSLLPIEAKKPGLFPV